MIRRTRRLIFYTFFILFFILAFVIILYAQGYSFDWQKKSLVATGAFYFKSYPKEADIYVNDKYQGKTNKFIKRLLPKEYNIKISRSGYYDWQKTLKIDSKLVTEAKNILLIKKNPSINQVTSYNVKHLAFSNDKKKVIYLTDKATKEIDPEKQRVADPREIVTYSQFALRLLDLTSNADMQINSSIPNLKNLLDISWSANDKKLLLSFPYNYYYVFDLPTQVWSASGQENFSNDDSSEQTTAKIPKNAEETQRSNDNKKLLWRTKNEIGVIWLEQNKTEIIMKAFKEISQAIWYSETDQHIIFVIGDDIKVTELDGRDRRNTVNIFSAEKPEVFFNKWNKKLYLLSKAKLFEIDF